ncbi:hypothetical protein TPHA_0H01890 [Tetrapisispora phaffii CBS 4417]|uniref:Uncharacterized protein n=1 Tax=Tetrapisispora phaffii (strain ATCC 24235 / CBS 4417 / NBRC 1672 / NRRL Y-8282 / UCD 70-5) TaxID=1071381 RepID=G8BWE3_TETPH|nr:hypothetical protein TPHA_0H01890 [Tetrapisispora phaffii CBS 4417]CCE64394.1 hypothetical protein TPHA_0H01890 [Tetrapisispora phaffii CBS 4417]
MSTTVYTKSFQNCSENEVTGYNDCPSFLLSGKNKKNPLSSHRIVDNVPEYMYGKKIALNNIAPPPPSKRMLSRRVSTSSEISFSSMDSENYLEKNEIVLLVQNLLSSETRLNENEFQFYKKKIETNFLSSLENENTIMVLSQFFNEASKNKSNAQKLMKNWLVSDISVSNWVPSFIKIYENSI